MTGVASSVWVVIPTYNESSNIAALLDRVWSAMPSARVLIVDDGSPDGTADIVRARTVSDSRLHLLVRPRKLGLGTAYVAGFKVAIREGADVVVQLDADLGHDPADIPALVAATASADLVLGSRYVEGGRIENWRWHRLLLSRSANWYARRVLGLPIRDVTSGFRAWRAERLAAMPLDEVRNSRYAFQAEMVHAAVRHGLRMREHPIVFRDRTVGASKICLKDVLTGVVMLANVPRFRRERFATSAAALVLLGVSLLFALLTALRQSRPANLWSDEAFTVAWVRSPWNAFWTLARRDSGNGLAHALLLRAIDWMAPGSDARLMVFEMVSILAWLGVIVVVYRCFARQGHRLWGGATCLSMAITTAYQRYATEVRPYPLAALIVASLVLLSLDSARLGRRVWLIVLLLGVTPFIHPLLIPLVLYFTVVFARNTASGSRWLVLVAGLTSSAGLISLARTNPRGDDQLYWLASWSLRGSSQVISWFATTGVVSTVSPFGGLWGRVTSLATLVVLGWSLGRGGAYQSPSPTRTLLFAALAPLAFQVAIVGSWSLLGSHDYLSSPLRYLYPVLPLWTIVSSCALLGLVTSVQRQIRERRQNHASDGPYSLRIASRPSEFFLILLIVGACVSVASATVRRTGSTVRGAVWSDPPNKRDYLVEDLLATLPTLPELGRLDQRVGLTVDDSSFMSLLAAQGFGRLDLPTGVEVREPFDTCVPADSGLPGAPSVRYNAPAALFGDVFSSIRPLPDLWIVLNSGGCVDARIRALPGPKTLLSYVPTARSFNVVRLAG